MDRVDQKLKTSSGSKQEIEVPGSFQRFSEVATILGFANDSISLISILYSTIVIISSLFAIRTVELTPYFLFSNIAITPFHLFALWAVSIFIFLGICRKEWDMNKNIREYKPKFWLYIIWDIVLGFRKPFLSSFSGIFLVLFVWLFVEMLLSSSIFQGIAVVIGISLFLVGGSITVNSLDENDKKDRLQKEALFRLKEKAQLSMIKDWGEWERRIQEQLRKSWYASTSCISDLISVKGILPSDAEDILSKYATLHPRQVTLGYVYDAKTHEPVFTFGLGKDKAPLRVLVSLRKVPKNDYLVLTIPLAASHT